MGHGPKRKLGVEKSSPDD